MESYLSHDTIAAISTPPGSGGIAVIRVSGPEALSIVDSAWRGKRLAEAASHTAHLGKYVATSGELLDECVATVFLKPSTFTGEDVVEISVHGSRWIQREMVSDLVRRGARVAEPGEFTKRAFINGRLDLAQAEGVADLIASSSRMAHAMAVSQTRGNFSRQLDTLRDNLTDFASLLELELDFSEEDVEFADRSRLKALVADIIARLDRLAASYSAGAVLKDGVPVVIAGVPNAGKSSVLNLLLNDDKAIVSDVPGTTRDFIEDTCEIDGILYRFIDTAGLHDSDDKVEKIGMERALGKIRDAAIIIWVVDTTADVAAQMQQMESAIGDYPRQKVIILENKSDLHSNPITSGNPEIADDSETSDNSTNVDNSETSDNQTNVDNSETSDNQINVCNLEEVDNHGIAHRIRFSTMTGEGVDQLHTVLGDIASGGYHPDTDIMVTNARHYESIVRGAESLRMAEAGIEVGLSADFIAQDVRETLHHLAVITGSITTDTLLHSIFSRFCIGK